MLDLSAFLSVLTYLWVGGHHAKTIFQKSHKAWYYEDASGRQVRLGTDEKEAYEEYGRLIAGQQPATSKTTVAEIVDAFLVWTQEHKKPTTFDWYTRHCQSFIDHIGKSLRVTELKPLHVTAWLKAKCKGCNSTTQNGAVRAIARAFNWTVKQGLLPSSPIAQMERPRAKPRDVFH